jgi:hypothetical protein
VIVNAPPAAAAAEQAGLVRHAIACNTRKTTLLLTTWGLGCRV